MTSSASIESCAPTPKRNIQVYKMGANPEEQNRKRKKNKHRGRSGDTEDQVRDLEEHKRENAEPKEDTGEAINYLSILLVLISFFLKKNSKFCRFAYLETFCSWSFTQLVFWFFFSMLIYLNIHYIPRNINKRLIFWICFKLKGITEAYLLVAHRYISKTLLNIHMRPGWEIYSSLKLF